MKRKNLFSIFMILVIATAISACGKDNKKEDPNAVSRFNNPVFNNGANPQAAASYQDFINKLNANQFNNQGGTQFSYTNFSGANTQNEPDCDTFLGFINYCSSSSGWNSVSYGSHFSRSGSNYNASVTHEHGNNTTEVLNYLKSISTAANIRDFQASGSVNYILTNDNTVYAIDFQKPMIANPVYKSASNGSGYTFGYY